LLDRHANPQLLIGVSATLTVMVLLRLWWLVGEKENSRREMAGQEEFFRTISHHASDMVCVTDPEGHVIYRGAQASRLADAPGSLSWAGVVHPEDRDGASAAFAQALAHAGQLETTELRARSVDGGWCWVEARIVNLLDVPNVRGIAVVLRDVTERRSLETQLVGAARQAGMAEIATNVLHNVGNVLNSVNVSANLVAQKVRGSRSAGLSKAVGLLDEHAVDLGDFLTTDPKGKALPGYLAKLASALTAERESIEVELRRLSEGIAHIAEIVSAQQSLTGVDAPTVEVNLVEVVDDALRMAGVATQLGLRVTRNVAEVGPVVLDRHRLLLILVNLITNATFAMGDQAGWAGQLSVTAEATDGPAVKISVTDNGEGIAPENLTRIFGHGFTTHVDGHGFGLHSSSLAAIEMGGELSVHSDGVGHGARFVLEVPTERQMVPA
jgi:PAS domain S-box-containing protein